MIKNDRWIAQMAAQGMISPFVPELVRRVERGDDEATWLGSDRNARILKPATTGRDVISYGASSYGYDIRLSPKDFRIFQHIPGTVIDPKDFSPDNLRPVDLHYDENGDYFIIPAHTYGLGVAMERLEIPDNITVICIGKSTYARCGIVANLTPGEAGWKGHLTLEFSNSSSADCRLYANEGIVQLLFLEGEPCEVSYEARQGKYQDQPESVVLAKV